MKVLVAHNRYQQRGGEDESADAEVTLLRRHGHEVIEFTEDNRGIGSLRALSVAVRTTWSPDSYRRVRSCIRLHRPDVLHVHNFFPLLSPSVYHAARSEGIPVVQTLHNYRLLCPNALLFREGRVCEDCLGRRVPWPGVLHACYRGSRAASAAVVCMLSVHNGLRTWSRAVDLYVTPSRFTRAKFIQGGLPADSIVVNPNFVDPDPGLGPLQRDYALFVGRLSPGKGVRLLLSAWAKLESQTQVPLKIVGDGPLAQFIAESVRRHPSVEWLGQKSLSETYAMLAGAAFLVVPSEWYETFGRVAVEAFATGTPVIVSGHGAVAELVEPGRTGLHFRASDPLDLAAQIGWALAHPHEMRQMGRAARLEFERRYTADRGCCERLLRIYEEGIQRAARRLP